MTLAVRWVVLPLSILLVGCAGTNKHLVPRLEGRTRASAVSCAGIPDKDETRDGQEVMVWMVDEKDGNSLSLTTPFSFSLALHFDGNCRVIASVRNGRIQQVSFSGQAAGLSGPNGVCKSALRGCLVGDAR